MDVQIAETAAGAARDAALLVARKLRRGGTLGLAGGSTPAPAYFVLRHLDLAWDRVTCWLPDERLVPSDHPESNTGMARMELVDHVPARLVAPDMTLEVPSAIAAGYDMALADVLPQSRASVVMLGMGSDGHTASLFSGTDALALETAGYVATWVASKESWRLTATMPLLQQAHTIAFLVTGTAKAPIVARVLRDAEPLPARLVAEGATGVTWILDRAAAAEL